MSPAKRSSSKSTSAKKTVAKKTAAAKKAVRSVLKKTTSKKTTVKKTTAKAAPKKTAAKKTTAKAAPKKTAAKKTTAKAAPKKTTAKKAAPKKNAAKKATPRKTPAKKTTAQAPTARKTAATKTTRAEPRGDTKKNPRTSRSRSAASAAGGLGARPPRGGTTPVTSAPARKVRPAKFDKEQLKKIRAQLESEVAELRRQQEELEQDSFTDSQSGMTGEVGLDDDFADAGTATFEREKDLSIRNNIRDLIDQITRAIERLDAGTYGLCERCGNPIDAARLKALPHALLCLDCKRREERAR